MWSLHVEEQFYLIFPLLVLHLTRLQLKRLLMTAIVAAPVIRLALAFWFPASPLFIICCSPAGWTRSPSAGWSPFMSRIRKSLEVEAAVDGRHFCIARAGCRDVSSSGRDIRHNG